MLNKISAEKIFRLASLEGAEKAKFTADYEEAQTILARIEKDGGTKFGHALREFQKYAENTINEDVELHLYTDKAIPLSDMEDIYTINYWEDDADNYHFQYFAPAVITTAFKASDGYLVGRIDGFVICFIG